jgi:peptidoglycan/LPS O-acetylase OafA/YrhL
MAAKRLTSLDGLRGIAALAVVVWHWQHFFAIGGVWQDGAKRAAEPFFVVLKPLYLQGWAAVDLFFVLSGFVFFWLYGDAIRTRETGASHFGLLRFSRLYPLHFAMLSLVAVLQFLFFHEHGVFFIYQANDWPHFIASLFMVQNWWPNGPQSFDGPAWSVSVEVLLYVLFFVACRVGLKAGIQSFIFAIGAGALFWFDEHIARGVIGFFMGGTMFACWKALRGHAREAAIARMTSLVSITGWIALAALLYVNASWLAGGETNVYFLAAFDYVLCPLTILSLALHERATGRSYRWLGYLGDISYSTYMIHFPMQLALALIAARLALTPDFFMHGYVMIAFYVVLITLGAASYHYFERPMQRWIRQRRSETVVAVAD